MRIDYARTRATVAAGIIVVGAVLASTQPAAAEPSGESRYLANDIRCSIPTLIWGGVQGEG